MDVVSVPLVDVQIVGQRRTLRGVTDLAASIQEVGLLQPIMVTPARVLVFGYHRLEACRSLGWDTLPAVVREVSDLERQFIEEQENLARNELTVLERAESAKRAKDIHEALHPETRNPNIRGGPGRGNKTTADSAVVSFTRAAAIKTGKAPRTVRTEVQIAESLTEETKEIIRDTPIADHKTDLLKLARIEEPEIQREVAQAVVEGYAPTVDEAVARKLREARAVPAPIRALQDAPDPEGDRMKFYALFEKRLHATEAGWLALEPEPCADVTTEDSIAHVEHLFEQTAQWIAQFRQRRSAGLRVVGGSRS